MNYPAPWIDDADTFDGADVARWALARVGVYETPPGSNRSGLIDAWNSDAGAPLGSPWCMSFARAAWKAAGLPLLGNAACEAWHLAAVKAGRWVTSPELGALALYDFGTVGGLADHCGVVVRVSPTILTCEGNTDETGSREGVGVFVKDRGGVRLLGYVSVGP